MILKIHSIILIPDYQTINCIDLGTVKSKSTENSTYYDLFCSSEVLTLTWVKMMLNYMKSAMNVRA